MANIAFSLVYTFPQTTVHDYSAGAVILTDKTIVVGLADSSGFEDHQQFVYSQDDGLNWTLGARLRFYQPARGPRMLHFPPNKLFFPAVDNYRDCYIYRSLDYGAHWTLIAIFTGKSTFPQNVAQPFAARTYDKTSGYFTGHFPNNAGADTANFLVTTDAGDSWTMGQLLSPGTQASMINPLANAGAGILLCAGNTNKLYRSTNYGTSWTGLGGLPDPDASTFIEAAAATFITRDIAIIAGIGNPQGGPFPPYAWRSTDAGLTWSILLPTAFSNWPTGGNLPWITEVKRLTRDSAIMGFQTRANMGNSPIRASTDQGQTWNIEGTGWDLSGKIAEAGGAIVTTEAGSIIVTVDVSHAGRNQTEIWRGTWICT
jgi:hypothetical protein